MNNTPQFCPRKECSCHQKENAVGKWFRPAGFYKTRVNGRVRRYQCLNCKKGFSDQTFSLTYYLHRKLDFYDVVYRCCSGCGIRAIGRYFKISEKAIQNRINRFSRNYLGLISLLRKHQTGKEDLVFDGIESFVRSQYAPNNVQIIVGRKSQFFYLADHAYIRRKGRMTEAQKERRAELEAVYGTATKNLNHSLERVCDYLKESLKRRPGFKGSPKLNFFSDEKIEYRRIIKKYRYFNGRINHIRISSKAPRTIFNPLFAVNYLDRELRKNLAMMVRETTRWAQNANNFMSRIYAHACIHNHYKPFRINEKEKTTHDREAGFNMTIVNHELNSIFTHRTFYSHLNLNKSEKMVWFRKYKTHFTHWIESVPKFVYN